MSNRHGDGATDAALREAYAGLKLDEAAVEAAWARVADGLLTRPSPRPGRRRAVGWLAAAAATAVVVAAWPGGGQSVAEAGPIAAVDSPRTLRWRETYFYWDASDQRADGPGVATDSWVTEFASPGVYVHPPSAEDGGYTREDHQTGDAFSVDPADRTVTRWTIPAGEREPGGPFGFVREYLKSDPSMPVRSISVRGEMTVDGETLTRVVAVADPAFDVPYRMEFLFAKGTRELRAIWMPWVDGAALDDLLAGRHEPLPVGPGVKYHIATLYHEIEEGVGLTPVPRKPPAGYAVTRRQPGEDEPAGPWAPRASQVADYLMAAAGFAGGVFPDNERRTYDHDALAKWFAVRGERPPEVQAFIDAYDRLRNKGLSGEPLPAFAAKYAEPGSLRYVGAGVRAGEADRIVFWYRSRRDGRPWAMFGDGDVRAVAAEELPFDVRSLGR